MARIANFCMTCGAALEVRDWHGTPRPVCASCNTAIYFDPKVAVVVFITSDGTTQGDTVLLVQRAIDPGAGKWALPAGFVEHDEAPEDAARREALEETGVQIEITRLLDVFPKRDHGLADIVIAYAARITGGTLQADDDAAALGWFARDAVPELVFYPSQTLVGKWQRDDL
jgi:8-oxo-dGTP diphosphatase